MLEPADNDIVFPDFCLRWEPVAAAWFYEVQLSEYSDFCPHEIYSTGATQLRFAGRDDDNEPVPAGSYVATVEAGGTKDVTAFVESRVIVVEH